MAARVYIRCTCLCISFRLSSSKGNEWSRSKHSFIQSYDRTQEVSDRFRQVIAFCWRIFDVGQEIHLLPHITLQLSLQYLVFYSVNAYIAGLLAGVTLVFEPMGRQSEIALYTLNKSMEVVYNMGLRRKLPVRLPMGECVLNGVAIAILAFVYLSQPETFRDSYRKVLDQLMKEI